MLKKISVATLIIVLVSSVAVAFQTDQAWPTFDSPEGRFSVVLPTKPTVEVKDIDSAVGKLTMYAYSSSNNVAYFMVSFGDYPKDPTDAAQKETVLDGVRSGVVKGLEGTLLSETKITIDGHPGRAFKAKRIVEGSEMVFNWKIYLVGRRLYQMAVATTTPNAESPDVGRFLASFKLKV
jgi:hypothetical protein